MSRSLLRRVLVLSFPALLGAASAGAQQPPTAQPVTDDDPRRGPRLVYEQGPAECLPEKEFRGEVAIATRDGIDHLHASSPDVVRVWFEKIPGGYRGTVEYTDTTGVTDVPQVHAADHCEVLARWVASTVSDTIPRPPAPTCPACGVCGISRPSAPCPVPSKPRPWRMDLSVGLSAYVMMTAFLSADVAPGFGIAGDVRGEIFGIGAELRLALPSRAYAREPIPGETSYYPAEFDLTQFSALLVPCARYKYFVGCGVAQLGWFIAQSISGQNFLISYSFGPRIGFDIPFGERFAVFGFGEVLFAPAPSEIQFVRPLPDAPDIPPNNTRWVQSVASGYFGAGVSVKFQ